MQIAAARVQRWLGYTHTHTRVLDALCLERVRSSAGLHQSWGLGYGQGKYAVSAMSSVACSAGRNAAPACPPEPRSLQGAEGSVHGCGQGKLRRHLAAGRVHRDIQRVCDGGLPSGAGREIGNATTKRFLMFCFLFVFRSTAHRKSILWNFDPW